MKPRVIIIILTFIFLLLFSSCTAESGKDNPDAHSHVWVDGVCNICGYDSIEGNLQYALSGDGSYYTVRGIGTFTGDTLIIRGEYNGKPVTKIESKAFLNCNDIIEVVINERIIEIGSQAFENCSKLSSINLPESLTTIDDNAFYNCSMLENVELPSNIFSIGYSAFGSCNNLKYNYVGIDPDYPQDGNLYLGNKKNPYLVLMYNIYSETITYAKKISVHNDTKVIAASALNNMLYATEIQLPNNLVNIGKGAFNSCSAIQEIKIPDSTIQIEDSAFYNCKQLSTLYLGEGISYMGKSNIYNSLFEGCNSLCNIHIPSIKDWLEIEFANEQSNPLNSSNTYNRVSLFIDNVEVTNVKVPESITKINNYAFYGYKQLKNVSMHDNVTKIGDRAFYSCTSLENITLSPNLIDLGTELFNECSNLTYSIYDNGCYLGSIDNPYLILVKSKSKEITSCKINEKTKIIMEAFSSCINLESLIIPDSVVNIYWEKCFEGCNGLKSVTIGNGILSIDDYAFENCDKLQSVTIPMSVKAIGKNAFAYCFNLESIIYEGTMGEWENLNKGIGWDHNTDNYKVYSSDMKKGLAKNNVFLRSFLKIAGNELGRRITIIAFSSICAIIVVVLIIKRYVISFAKRQKAKKSPKEKNSIVKNIQAESESWTCECGTTNSSSTEVCQNCFEKRR